VNNFQEGYYKAENNVREDVSMMVFKRKQIVVLSLVLMIVVAGYLQYSYKKSGESLNAGNSSDKPGEAVYVDTSVVSEENMTDAVSQEKEASKQANDFFTQSKLEKEITRSKDEDALKEITKDVNANAEAKSKAYDQMMGIVSNNEKEMRIEILIKQRGYSDALVLLGEDESMDITIKSPTLNSQQVAQVVDIASRQANVNIKNIKVKNIY
jgi:stage III sporulation protein AH